MMGHVLAAPDCVDTYTGPAQAWADGLAAADSTYQRIARDPVTGRAAATAQDQCVADTRKMHVHADSSST